MPGFAITTLALATFAMGTVYAVNPRSPVVLLESV